MIKKKFLNKTIITLIVSFFLLLSCEQKRERKLTVTIDESINKTPQWVYWFSLYANEYNIIDSCFIEKGQKEFTLHDRVINDSVGMNWIIFSKSKNKVGNYVRIYFRLGKEDKHIKFTNVTVDRRYNDKFTVSGSKTAEEVFRFEDKTDSVRRRIQAFRDYTDRLPMSDTVRYKMAMDSCRIFRKYIHSDLPREMMYETKSSNAAAHFLWHLEEGVKYQRMPREVLTKAVTDMNERYPDDYRVQDVINKPLPLPKSERSKHFGEREREILFNLTRIRNGKKIPEGAEENVESKTLVPTMTTAANAEETKVITPTYKLGGKVKNLTLNGIDGKQIPLGEIKTKYIFIDFWAEWCAPCLRELPHIVEVQKKYKKELTVYAISVANSEKAWRDYIKLYECEPLTHVYAGNWLNKNTQVLTNSFGLTSIPANFLLDQNRNIIAINLYGESLYKKMAELLK